MYQKALVENAPLAILIYRLNHIPLLAFWGLMVPENQRQFAWVWGY
jgi:hypothetical protein